MNRGKKMKIYETHAHLDFPQFDHDRDILIRKCIEKGITPINNIGVNKETNRASIQLAEKYDEIYATVGYHPHDADKLDIQEIKKLAAHQKVVAIGEIGLDYYRNLTPPKVQKKAFIEQLKIAKELEKPVVIHDRDAHQDILEILEEFLPEKVVFHCFSGDAIFLEKILEKGWFASFTGIITYKNSQLADVIRMIPTDRFFVETDSPYLSPQPNRGKRNSPSNLQYIIQKIAEIKFLTPKKIVAMSYQNAVDFFLSKKA